MKLISFYLFQFFIRGGTEKKMRKKAQFQYYNLVDDTIALNL